MHRNRYRLLVFFLPLALWAQQSSADPCTRDLDCNDGVFCNGLERCVPGDPAADADDCVPASSPQCGPGEICFEDGGRCETPCDDADDDGFCSTETGGMDCDDTDPRIKPTATEVCSFSGPGDESATVDEDCDPSTFGFRDEDHDGFTDARCCNGVNCGEDCNDDNRSIVPGAMVCNSDESGVFICTDTGLFEESPCPRLTGCVTQPNGTGLCAFKPGRLGR